MKRKQLSRKCKQTSEPLMEQQQAVKTASENYGAKKTSEHHAQVKKTEHLSMKGSEHQGETKSSEHYGTKGSEHHGETKTSEHYGTKGSEHHGETKTSEHYGTKGSEHHGKTKTSEHYGTKTGDHHAATKGSEYYSATKTHYASKKTNVQHSAKGNVHGCLDKSLVIVKVNLDKIQKLSHTAGFESQELNDIIITRRGCSFPVLLVKVDKEVKMGQVDCATLEYYLDDSKRIELELRKVDVRDFGALIEVSSGSLGKCLPCMTNA